MRFTKKSRLALTRFIQESRNKQELKRALAVKMYYEGHTLKETAKHLNTSFQFVSKWKNRFVKDGISALKVAYQGSRGYLTPTERRGVIRWLQRQSCCTLQQLRVYIQQRYEKYFRSRRSYYRIFKEAHLSFKRTQKINPRRKAQHVYAKRHALKKGATVTNPRNTGEKAAFLFCG